MENKLRAKDYFVAPTPLRQARALVEKHHYAQGCSLTAVYSHGLYRCEDLELVGAALWLPPTRVAAESVNREHWRRVIALSRLVVLPEVPANAASFLISGSVRIIKAERRFASLVSYADSGQGHTGAIYKAANWAYVETKGPGTYRWIDWTGKQVAQQSTKTRTTETMRSLGYIRQGPFKKHKFVLHLEK